MPDQKGKTFEEQISLTNLELPEFDGERLRRIMRESDEEKKRLQEQYGDGWWDAWKKIKGIDKDYSVTMKKINTLIYQGRRFYSGSCSPGVYPIMMNAWKKRMEEFYGPDYESFPRRCPGGYPNAAELLLNDALKTGKWKELPNDLQEEYHRRVEEFRL